MIPRYVTALVFVSLALAGCETAKDDDRPRIVRRPSAPAADSAPATVVPTTGRPTILFLGTSLTAGLGVSPDQAYPALLQEKLDSAGLDYRVVNAGVSGETSAGARSRIDWLLRQRVAVLVVETGANDGLRGTSPDALRANLEAILDRAHRQSPPPEIVVVGMEAPPNYGATYTSSFRAVYPGVAREYDAAFVPFLLDGVAGVDSLNQADGIHPTPAGHARIAETVWAVLEPVLRGGAVTGVASAPVR